MRNISKDTRVLWLDGIFDQKTLLDFPSISPAINLWQSGFVYSLQSLDSKVEVIGHPCERIWPFGRAVISANLVSLAPQLSGMIVPYVNIPLLRRVSQTLSYFNSVLKSIKLSGRPDYVITVNTSYAITVAKYLRKYLGVPWICIVADGIAPQGADGYVYLTWNYYKSLSAPGPKIHIDGGIPLIPVPVNNNIYLNQSRNKILMYMGALTKHGGSTFLARAFHLLPDGDIQLWIAGRGVNSELTRLSKIDSRIKIFGFVSDFDLHELASKAGVFVNPRPINFSPNKLNYPSKLLHYLAYGKPILSTFSDGLSPEYTNVLIPINEESESGMAAMIQNTLNMSETEYLQWCNRITLFNETHTWVHQITRFISWLPLKGR